VNVTTLATLTRPQLAHSSRLTRTLPPIAALAYPGLIWCGPALGSLFLVIAMAVPLVGLLIGHRLDHRRYPYAHWIAFAVVGTPALYSFLGGWLDGVHIAALKGLPVWMVIWGVSTGIAIWERPAQAQDRALQPAHSLLLPFVHGVSAVLIACFAVFHLANHFAGLWGGEAHLAIMHALRPFYRSSVVEPLLLGCIGFQLLTGAVLLKRKIAYAGSWVDTLQVASALYLVIFFFSHLSAVLRARYLQHTDTNWTWLTSANLLTDPWSARLAPYYFLGVIALGVHGGAGVRRVMLNHGRSMRLADTTFYAVVAGSAVLSAAIMVGLIRGSQ
jgi:succinate dehydrogenase/fumarate reductase cytochrome b subunit